MVQARPGDRRERGDAALHRRTGDGVPGLDRAPVVREQVHRRVRGHRVRDGAQVVGQPVQVVGVGAGRGAGRARAAHVVGDDAVPAAQGGGHAVPDRVVVRVAVHREHDRSALAAVVLDREPEPVGSDHLTVRHSVIVENLSTRRKYSSVVTTHRNATGRRHDLVHERKAGEGRTCRGSSPPPCSVRCRDSARAGTPSSTGSRSRSSGSAPTCSRPGGGSARPCGPSRSARRTPAGRARTCAW